MTIDVVTKYTWTGSTEFDDAAIQSVGRLPDFSGCGFGERDLGWTCKSQIEAERIKRGLTKIGLTATIQGAP